jgi:HSP20 family protein
MRDRDSLTLESLFRRGARASQGPWKPPADVYRTRDGWLVKFELAGVRPNEVKVELSGSHLRISGMRRDFAIREAAHSYSMEISYNHFERTLEFPEQLDACATELDYRDGMLLVALRRRFG